MRIEKKKKEQTLIEERKMILTHSQENFLFTSDKRLLVNKRRIQKNWMRKTYTEIPVKILAHVDVCELNFVAEELYYSYLNSYLS